MTEDAVSAADAWLEAAHAGQGFALRYPSDWRAYQGRGDRPLLLVGPGVASRPVVEAAAPPIPAGTGRDGYVDLQLASLGRLLTDLRLLGDTPPAWVTTRDGGCCAATARASSYSLSRCGPRWERGGHCRCLASASPPTTGASSRPSSASPPPLASPRPCPEERRDVRGEVATGVWRPRSGLYRDGLGGLDRPLPGMDGPGSGWATPTEGLRVLAAWDQHPDEPEQLAGPSGTVNLLAELGMVGPQGLHPLIRPSARRSPSRSSACCCGWARPRRLRA
ncbi:MAG: hypothetical protein M3N32_04785 [Actinomycetota bacterium]|nr:hypothetical protein [Actinomycetota bacterium]